MGITEPSSVAAMPEYAKGTYMSDTPKLSLDFKGLLCPMPVVKIAQAIKQVQVGELVEAVATDPGVMADIPAWARSTGHELVALEKQDKVYKFILKRMK
jgi:TusA-related sulfurtransferase